MRPIVPLIFKGIKPIDMADVPGVEIIFVAPTDLYVDDSYQREITPKSEKLIRHIVEEWSYAKMNVPVATYRDGRLLCINGQHTAIAAATHGGIPLIPVMVVAAPTVAEQADAFISHSKDRVTATRGQIHHAALAAGDQDAIRLQRVVDSVGMRFVLSPKPPTAYRPGETIAVGTVKSIVTRRTDALARAVLSAVVKSGITPILADDLKIADALICEDDFSGEFDAERTSTALKSMTPKQRQDAEQLAVAKRMPVWRALAAVIYRDRKPTQKRGAAEPTPQVTSLASPNAKVEPGFKSVLARPLPSPSARVIDRRYSGVVPLGEPEPGRSALDQRRRATA